MFTGIIETVGQIEGVSQLEGGCRLRITTQFASELRVDESVAVNGVCLTVVSNDDHTFETIAVEETLAKTNVGDLSKGDPANLERAMKANGRFDGHIVQGHVDATGTIKSIEQLADSWLITIAFSEEFAANLIPQGSITVDGISLTVARLTNKTFSVAIIPHTWEQTTVHTWKPGRRVNLEFDVIGKYVARILESRS
ncbi:MAG: riboflavin synthase [Rubricoccaceae bacterium]|nr:riboflavin synthase [Rubricoccaceae bacterium]